MALALPDASILRFKGQRLWKVVSQPEADPTFGELGVEIITVAMPWRDVQHLIAAGSALGMLGPTPIGLGAQAGGRDGGVRAPHRAVGREA